MPTPRMSTLFRLGSVLALALVLAACTKGGQFDPTEIFNNDMFELKKRIPGDREPVFPDGVPGATSGVPPDLVKGYQQPPEQAETPAPEQAPVAEAKPKPKPKPKPKLAAAPAQPQQQQQQQDPIWNQKGAAPPVNRISIGRSSQQAAPAAEPSGSQPAWPSPPAAPQTAWPAPPSGSAAQTAQPAWPNPPAPATSSQ